MQPHTIREFQHQAPLEQVCWRWAIGAGCCGQSSPWDGSFGYREESQHLSAILGQHIEYLLVEEAQPVLVQGLAVQLQQLDGQWVPTSGAVDLTGCLLRLFQSGNLQTYALFLAMGLLLMLILFLV